MPGRRVSPSVLTDDHESAPDFSLRCGHHHEPRDASGDAAEASIVTAAPRDDRAALISQPVRPSPIEAVDDDVDRTTPSELAFPVERLNECAVRAVYDEHGHGRTLLMLPWQLPHFHPR